MKIKNQELIIWQLKASNFSLTNENVNWKKKLEEESNLWEQQEKAYVEWIADLRKVGSEYTKSSDGME